jgi:hypothetical protein
MGPSGPLKKNSTQKLLSNSLSNIGLKWITICHLDSSKEILLIFENYIFTSFLLSGDMQNAGNLRKFLLLEMSLKIRKNHNNNWAGPPFGHPCPRLGAHLSYFF